MAISDLFRPKCKHSDPGVRKLAVEKLTDETALSDIAQNDTNSAVRLAAVTKLTDPQRLARLIENESDTDVCLAALDRIGDPALLGKIAQQHRTLEVRTAASKGLAELLRASIMLGDSAAAISLLEIPGSAHIKVILGTVRGRYWMSMGDIVMSGGQATTVGDAEGVLVTVANTNALKKVSVEEAVALGVIGSKPATSVPSGTTLRIPVTTFDVTSLEMQGPCLVAYKSRTQENNVIKLLLEPRDVLNVHVVLSADGTQLLAWDLRDAKADDHPDTARATYPNSARKKYGGFNPESQTATYTQHQK